MNSWVERPVVPFLPASVRHESELRLAVTGPFGDTSRQRDDRANEGKMLFRVLFSSILAALGLSQEVEVKPYMTLRGSDSKVVTREYRLISSHSEWDALWHRHSGKLETSEKQRGFRVDFKAYRVIAIFQGKGWNSRGVVGTLHETDGGLRLRFDELTYQTFGPDGGGVRVAAYGFFVVPKSFDRVVLEENVQGIIGDPPVWKPRGALRLQAASIIPK